MVTYKSFELFNRFDLIVHKPSQKYFENRQQIIYQWFVINEVTR